MEFESFLLTGCQNIAVWNLRLWSSRFCFRIALMPAKAIPGTDWQMLRSINNSVYNKIWDFWVVPKVYCVIVHYIVKQRRGGVKTGRLAARTSLVLWGSCVVKRFENKNDSATSNYEIFKGKRWRRWNFMLLWIQHFVLRCNEFFLTDLLRS